MKNLVILFIGLVICLSSIGQDDHLRLYKLPNKNKAKKIKLNKTFTIGTDLQKTDIMRSWKITEGRLLSIKRDSITLHLNKELISNELRADCTYTITTETIKYADTLPEVQFIETYAIDNIDYIEISRSNETLEGIGIAGAIISGLTTFVVAPLVSINYKEGTFNANTYKNWALAGTAGMAVSVTFIIASNKIKGYRINEKWPACSKHTWTLRK